MSQDATGRISGDSEWKRQRGEGGDKPSICPFPPLIYKPTLIQLEGTATVNTTDKVTTGEAEEVQGSEVQSSVVLQYVSLGGKAHNDTAPFDTSLCLWSMVEELARLMTLTPLQPLPLPLPLPPIVETAAVSVSLRGSVPGSESGAGLLAGSGSEPGSLPPLPPSLSLSLTSSAATTASDKMDDLTAIAQKEKRHPGDKNIPTASTYGEHSVTTIRRKEVSSVELAVWIALRVNQISIFAGKLNIF